MMAASRSRGGDRMRMALVVGAVFWELFTASGPSAALDSSENSGVPDVGSLDPYELTHTPPELDAWDKCTEGDLGMAQRLCPTSEPNMTTYQIAIYNQLAHNEDDDEALCKIDNVLVDVLKSCPALKLSNPFRDLIAAPIASLMQKLANNWRRQGAFERADRLFYQAYAMLLRERSFDDVRISVMRDWAKLKIDMGQKEQARQLASMQLETARERYVCRSGSRSDLVVALKFQSRMRADLGDAAGSAAALDEADQLSRAPDLCQGMIVRGVRRSANADS